MSSDPGYDPITMRQTATQLESIIGRIKDAESIKTGAGIEPFWESFQTAIREAYKVRASKCADRDGQAVIMVHSGPLFPAWTT